MIPEKYIFLMNQEIDGANTPGETEELRLYLEKDEAGARYYRELRETLEIFDRAGTVAPPRELRERIVDEATADAAERQIRGQVIDRPALFERIRPGHAVAFAGGLLAAALVFMLLGRGDTPPIDRGWRDIYGTITEELPEPGSSPVRIELPRLTGMVSAVPHERGTAVLLALRDDTGSSLVTVVSAGGGITEMGRVSAGDASTLSLDGSRAAILPAGEGEYVLLFRHAAGVDPALRVEIEQHGQIVLTRDLPAAR